MPAKIRIMCRPGLWLEVEENTPAEAIKVISWFHTVFAEPHCGMCKSERIFFRHRMPQGQFNYYSIRCEDCGAEVQLGENQAPMLGAMYVKRKDAQGNWDNQHKGWAKYSDQKRDEELERRSGETTPSEEGSRYSEPVGEPASSATPTEDIPF